MTTKQIAVALHSAKQAPVASISYPGQFGVMSLAIASMQPLAARGGHRAWLLESAPLQVNANIGHPDQNDRPAWVYSTQDIAVELDVPSDFRIALDGLNTGFATFVQVLDDSYTAWRKTGVAFDDLGAIRRLLRVTTTNPKPDRVQFVLSMRDEAVMGTAFVRFFAVIETVEPQPDVEHVGDELLEAAEA